MKDLMFQSITLDILSMNVQEENIHQLLKWGVQDRTPFEWITYLTEEVGELAKELSDYEYGRASGEPDKVYTEAIQVATLALKIAEMASALPRKDSSVCN